MPCSGPLACWTPHSKVSRLSSGPRTLGPSFLGRSFPSFHQCSALTPDMASGPAYLEASRNTPLPQMTGGFGDRHTPDAHLGVAPVGDTLPAEQVAAGCGCRMPAFLQAQCAQWGSGNCSFLCMAPGMSRWMGHNGAGVPLGTWGASPCPVPPPCPTHLRWDRPRCDRPRCSLHSLRARCFCWKP